ncbi:MAG: hypothetical protein ACTMH4_02735 [Sphingobacterium sp.]
MQLDFGFEMEPTTEPQSTPKSFKMAQSDLVFYFMDSLSSAIIVFPSDWQDAVPQLLLKNVTLARLLTQGERNALTASIHVKCR